MLMHAGVSRTGQAVVMADIPDPEVAPRAQARTFAPSYSESGLASMRSKPVIASNRPTASKARFRRPTFT